MAVLMHQGVSHFGRCQELPSSHTGWGVLDVEVQMSQSQPFRIKFSNFRRSRIHDELQGNLAFWPDQYSGRAVISETHQAASSCPNEQNPPKADKEVPLIVWA